MEKEKFPASLEKEFEKFGVTPIIYRPKGMRYVTVCLLVRNKKVLARGISICSPMDEYNWPRGHNQSVGRAIKAMYHRMKDNTDFNGEVRNDPRLPIGGITCWCEERPYVDKVECSGFDWKSEYMPKLTETEEAYLKNFNSLRKV